jgi:hypothetical protein
MMVYNTVKWVSGALLGGVLGGTTMIVFIFAGMKLGEFKERQKHLQEQCVKPAVEKATVSPTTT